jgi:hypothetical protein
MEGAITQPDLLRPRMTTDPCQRSRYVVTLTAEQFTRICKPRSHPAQCPSKAILIYSWNECDEGGNAIIPIWTGGTPDTSRIAALQKVAW